MSLKSFKNGERAVKLKYYILYAKTLQGALTLQEPINPHYPYLLLLIGFNYLSYFFDKLTGEVELNFAPLAE